MSAIAHERSLRRFFPTRAGGPLKLTQIRGPWRPSGSVDGAGMFAVVWSAHTLDFWAPLHDFAPVDQLRLIEACRHLDQASGHSGSWSGRGF